MHMYININAPSCSACSLAGRSARGNDQWRSVMGPGSWPFTTCSYFVCSLSWFLSTRQASHISINRFNPSNSLNIDRRIHSPNKNRQQMHNSTCLPRQRLRVLEPRHRQGLGPPNVAHHNRGADAAGAFFCWVWLDESGMAFRLVGWFVWLDFVVWM
jgi:hypothetical protein